METIELKIQVPAGMEIDKENSTFECIKFKLIQKKWRDNKDANIAGYYIDPDSTITSIAAEYRFPNTKDNHNIFAEEKQARSALAMAQISQIMTNDERFGGVVTDEEWNNDNWKYVIYRKHDSVHTDCLLYSYKFLAFHTPHQRDLFLKENEDLVKDYLMID